MKTKSRSLSMTGAAADSKEAEAGRSGWRAVPVLDRCSDSAQQAWEAAARIALVRQDLAVRTGPGRGRMGAWAWDEMVHWAVEDRQGHLRDPPTLRRD